MMPGSSERAFVILTIDDTALNLALVKAALGRAGYQVEGVSSAEEASKWLENHRPDLILLDIHMPGTDGFAFARSLKSEPATAATPLVAITALSLDEERARAAGFDGYIGKPIDLRTFSDRIASYLPPPGK